VAYLVIRLVSKEASLAMAIQPTLDAVADHLCVVLLLVRITVVSARGASVGFGAFALLDLIVSGAIVGLFLADRYTRAVAPAFIEISPDVARLIQLIRAKGRYATDSEVLTTALQLLHERNQQADFDGAVAKDVRNRSIGNGNRQQLLPE
jgi:hypothetical protein